MKKLLFGLVAFTNIINIVKAQQPDPLRTQDADKQQRWVDSIYQKMSLEEKIGQLFMVQVFSTQENKNTEFAKQLVQKHYIGGIIFSKGGPGRQAKLTNQYQALAKVPLFIAMDAEWGLAMRLDSTYAYPWNMTLGAIKNNDLIEKTGYRIAKHCQRLGVHIDFAPDIDINTNPENPIIGNRSFGEDKQNVANKGISFAKGMQSVGVLANAKHFPGHGDTSQDSHLTLPKLNFTRERIEQIELYPFRELIAGGIASIMVGHLNIPALEKKDKPSSLSYHIVTEILKEQLGFNGLIFTDALGMKGVANYAKEGDVDLMAFLAGNDVLLMPSDAIKGIQKIKEAYQKGIVTESRLAHSVKKILKAKYWAGLNTYLPIEKEGLHADLHTREDDLLTEKLYENAITLVKNTENMLPIKQLDTQNTAYLKLGDDSGSIFYQNLRLYEDVKEIKGKTWAQISKEIAPYDRIIIGYHRPDNSPWAAYKFSKQEQEIITNLSQSKKIVLTIFARPYALLDIPKLKPITSILVAYQNSSTSQRKAAQIIYGAIDAKGSLPVSAHTSLPVQTSLYIKNIKRLQYGMPESVGMNPFLLEKIDSIAKLSISQRMTPSVQVLVARFGKVIYNKSFGYYTYESRQRASDTTLYDLASLTKILATLPELMLLYDKKQFTLTTPLSTLLPELKGSNKSTITVGESLAHYAKFQSWLPFYTQTIDPVTKNALVGYYSSKQSSEYPTEVAKGIYLRKGYDQVILSQIIQSNLIKKKRYLYSDLPYYFFQKYIENEKKTSLDKLVQADFYKNMGAYRLTYLPLQHFPKNQIIPTEKDTSFRHQEIQGYVHDQGAAMLGGVGGHAGLFGTANDVAKMMQLFLQKGYYGGKQFFSEDTFNTFNSAHFANKNNRRGVGFDKPQPRGEDGPTCDCVSLESFGHTGFTGTYAWADPKSEIVYVFLSNRTYPSSENKKLIEENIRTKIQRVIQEAIIQ
ncbi:glycoside hydrolase family 3 N-terminal domain-containing protein [Capnocytophaga catalasegens]|uniref:beta-N-acetylhexosaminidase n=1 Tax=Capnocytophaga catalasegens TaxID=1004260 RepID=A0AAV5AUH7_9FLAO|nr:glycoside hydrolase family 3 N-terminal domain-containing protein [Capnocytophaga catalasegens]GIZ16095.1 beta-N-acetylglucosaminidase [Capnocytophaga catalasegens]GJM50254.1 beta-N-acetylglucosaminidase [Capnocytophaga catalasegens]GJM53485.1 beta-N-acetylglucosaminidase [Capnocytophaga catalasegens]